VVRPPVPLMSPWAGSGPPERSGGEPLRTGVVRAARGTRATRPGSPGLGRSPNGGKGHYRGGRITGSLWGLTLEKSDVFRLALPA